MSIIVTLENSAGELTRVELYEGRATPKDSANAAIGLIAATGYALHPGDVIRVREE